MLFFELASVHKAYKKKFTTPQHVILIKWGQFLGFFTQEPDTLYFWRLKVAVLENGGAGY